MKWLFIYLLVLLDIESIDLSMYSLRILITKLYRTCKNLFRNFTQNNYSKANKNIDTLIPQAYRIVSFNLIEVNNGCNVINAR